MAHPVSSSAGVRALDAHTISELGVPSLALMETAGQQVVRVLLERFADELGAGVLIAAGRGNNGGDGWVVARHLHLRGIPVAIWPTEGEHSPDGDAMRRSVRALGVPEVDGLGDCGVIVDALLGTGLSSELRGEVRERVAAINAHPAPVLAVDMPTGLDGDSGRVLGDAVRADVTVTFDRPRVGQLLEPGADLVGELVVVDIGLSGDAEDVARIAHGADIAPLVPVRAASSHKRDHGHLGVIAGSPQMAGAAVLTCHAALRAGAGLVTLLVEEATLPRLAQLRPEVMVRLEPAPGPEHCNDFTALAVGPGVGTEKRKVAWLRRLWRDARPAAVFDADGLTALIGVYGRSRFQRCITPHPGEAGRLLGITSGGVQRDRLGAATRLATSHPTLLKGRNTLVAGERVWVNRTGSADLATAGSGDVLTGLVGALLARGLEPEPALVAGAFLHGFAGELCGPGLVAGDLVDALPEAMARVGERTDVLDVRGL